MSPKPRPLWGGGPKIKGARFTPRQSFDSIYMAGDPVTALTEVWALVMLPHLSLPVLSNPLVIFSLEGILHNLLDLTDSPTIETLNTSVQEVTGPWASNPDAPTQSLGRAAYESGRIAGIKYGSAKNPTGLNFVIFPDRISISPGMYVAVRDPRGHFDEIIGTR
jgi:RES domain-containing protein